MALTPELQWSVPSAIDGLNQGQRKILFASFKKKLVREAKVSWLAGYAVEQAAYNHGQQSAEDTIISMAHDFVGSNNLNLLMPLGQFGSRDQGGLDNADGCDLFTCLSLVTRLLFPEADDILLNNLEESGRSVEPIWYIPIIPMVLVNGSRRCNSSVPSYNPRDIIANLRRLLNYECIEPMDPWYRGFKGRIEKTGATVEGSTYSTTGVIDVLDEHAVHITELPIHCWTLDYKDFLESFVCCKTKELYIEVAGNPEYNTLQVTWLSIHKDDFLKIMIQVQMVRLIHHDDTSFEFKLTLDKENMEIVVQEGLEKKLNLITAVGTTNMRLIDMTGLTIRKYKTPEEILEEFFDLRLEYYEKRKKVQLEPLNLDLLKISNKVRFILNVGHGDITVIDRELDDLVLELQRKGFAPFPETSKKPEGVRSISARDYEYLLSIPISSMTREKVHELYAETSKLEEKIKEVRGATPRLLWMKDLDALEAELDRLDNAMRAKIEARNMHHRRGTKRKNTAKKKAATNDGRIGVCKPVKAKPAAQKGRPKKVPVVEIVDYECNEAPLPEALLADNVLDSFSGHTEEEQKKGDTSRKVPSKTGAGKGRKPATVKATPKAVTRGAGAARNKAAAAAIASDGHCNDAKADMESKMVAEDSTTSAVTSPEKKVRRTRGRTLTISSRLTRGNSKKIQRAG